MFFCVVVVFEGGGGWRSAVHNEDKFCFVVKWVVSVHNSEV